MQADDTLTRGLGSGEGSWSAKGAMTGPLASTAPRGYRCRIVRSLRIMSAHPNILETPDRIRELLASTRTIAVIGIKTEAQADQPAFSVPAYMQAAGYEVIPVPVYYPDVTEILGRTVYRRLADIPGPVDLVDVFRRPADVPGHLDDILAKRPRAVWLQAGIRHDAAALTLAEAGILVVQDRCLRTDHRLLMRV